MPILVVDCVVGCVFSVRALIGYFSALVAGQVQTQRVRTGDLTEPPDSENRHSCATMTHPFRPKHPKSLSEALCDKCSRSLPIFKEIHKILSYKFSLKFKASV